MSEIAARAGTDDALAGVTVTLARAGPAGGRPSRVVRRDGSGLEFSTAGGSAPPPPRDRDPGAARIAIASAPSGTDPESSGRSRDDTSRSDGSDAIDCGPCVGCSGEVALVCEGNLENGAALREELDSSGHELGSDADAAVVAHLVEDRLADGVAPGVAVRSVVDSLEGGLAVLAVAASREAVYAATTGPELVLGIGECGHVIGTDSSVVESRADAVLAVRRGEAAVVTPTVSALTDLEGDLVVRSPETVDRRSPQTDGDGGAARVRAARGSPAASSHRNGQALARTLDGRLDPDTGTVTLSGVPPGTFADVERVRLVGSAAAAHAAAYGAHLLRARGLPAVAHRAREHPTAPVDEGTLVIGVGGPDPPVALRRSLRRAADAGARTLAVAGADAPLAHIADHVLPVRAPDGGDCSAPGVVTRQVATLGLVAVRLARDVPGASTDRVAALVAGLEELPSAVAAVHEDSTVRDAARRTAPRDAHLVVGQGVAAPAARVGADALARAGSVPTRALPAGRFERALLDQFPTDTGLVALFTGSDDDATRDAARVAAEQGTPVTAVTPTGRAEVGSVADAVLPIPDVDPELGGILATVQLHRLARGIDTIRGRPTDDSGDSETGVTVE